MCIGNRDLTRFLLEHGSWRRTTEVIVGMRQVDFCIVIADGEARYIQGSSDDANDCLDQMSWTRGQVSRQNELVQHRQRTLFKWFARYGQVPVDQNSSCTRTEPDLDVPRLKSA